MDNHSSTNQDLIAEISALTKRVKELEPLESRNRQLEEALKESESISRILADQSVLGVSICQDGVFKYVNPKFAEIHGYTVDELLDNFLFQNLVHPDCRHMSEERLRRHLAGETLEHRNERRKVRKNGELIDVENYGTLIYFHGKPARFGFTFDITEKKRAEEALRESEKKYRALASTVDSLVLVDRNCRQLFANEAYLKRIRTGQDSIIGKEYGEFHSAEATKIFVTAIERVFAIGNAYHDERFGARSSRWWSRTFSPVTNGEGIIAAITVSYRDITDLKQAEEALRAGEERYRRIIEGVTDYQYTVRIEDGQAVETKHNSACVAVTGYTAEEFAADHDLWIRMVAPEDREMIIGRVKQLLRGDDIPPLEHRLIRKDRALRWVSDNIVPCRNNAGILLSYDGVVKDITDRKHMEEDLLRAHKLESLGVLAGGIAHDFNNLMGIVQGYIDLALMELPPDHGSSKKLQKAMRSVEQTRDLTSRLLTFSRGGGPITELCDIKAIIQEAVLRTIEGTAVRVKFDFPEHLLPLEIDALQIKQCCYNLAMNAVEAMPRGGNLTIRAENLQIQAEDILPLKEGPHVKITFTDEGSGIREEHLPKIFDPYFTTKGMGARNGMGLGLSVCYSVLKKHNGYIAVEPQPGSGVTFALYLPVRMSPAGVKEAPRTLPARAARVLIMDDEPDMLGIERAYLEWMGYQVTEVRDGQEAIDTYKKALDSGNPFDLAVLDLTVRKGLGGQLVMERLLKIDPSIRAIIASGSENDPRIENYADYGFQGALTKPFKKEEMKVLVEKILRG